MKIRTGFVSNSSTSSFLIYGVALDWSEVLDLLKKGETSEAVDADEDEEDDYEEDEYDNVYEALEEALKDTDIEEHIPYDDQVYIGLSWSGVCDNETGKQFKDRASEQIAKVFGKEMSCSTLEEAWHD